MIVLIELASMIECYVASINKDSKICIENAVSTMTKIANDKLMRESLIEYASMMGKQIILPADNETMITTAHEVCATAALRFYEKGAFGKSDKQELEVKAMIIHLVYLIINRVF